MPSAHTRTNASIEGMVDRLQGLKENVIIGKLIPARSEIQVERREQIAELDLPESLLLEEEAELERMLAEREAGRFAGREPDEDDDDTDETPGAAVDELEDFEIPDTGDEGDEA